MPQGLHRGIRRAAFSFDQVAGAMPVKVSVYLLPASHLPQQVGSGSHILFNVELGMGFGHAVIPGSG